jgi:hypothetical protein
VLEACGDPQLRRAVLEHERAHLRHHHATLRLLCDLAAAVNPLLHPIARRVDFVLERWADEDAAGITSRSAVAEALAIVSLVSLAGRGSLALDGSSVPVRISELLDQHRPRSLPTALFAALAAALFSLAVIAVLHTCHDTEILFENLRRLRYARG